MIAEALRVNSLLTECHMGGNRLDAEGWCAIFDALRDNKDNKIAEWNLSQQGSVSEFSRANRLSLNPTIVKSLAAYVAVSGSLTELTLNCLGIGNKGATAIGAALAVNGSLTNLSLAGNIIECNDGVAIAEALKVNGSLTSLDLDFNEIGDEGATAIAEALQVNGSLKQLCMRGGVGKHAGLDAVCKAKGIALRLHSRRPKSFFVESLG